MNTVDNKKLTGEHMQLMDTLFKTNVIYSELMHINKMSTPSPHLTASL